MDPTRPRTDPPGRKVGYVIAVAINAVLLWVSHQLLDWEWPRFLTQEYERLLGIITVSFVATMVANALFVLVDPPWFKAVANTVTSAISFVVAVRTWQVFPFDFSTYARDWSTLVRAVLLVAMVGTAIATVANLILVPVRGRRRSHPSRRARGPARSGRPTGARPIRRPQLSRTPWRVSSACTRAMSTSATSTPSCSDTAAATPAP